MDEIEKKILILFNGEIGIITDVYFEVDTINFFL
jgi:hypothetical protein